MGDSLKRDRRSKLSRTSQERRIAGNQYTQESITFHESPIPPETYVHPKKLRRFVTNKRKNINWQRNVKLTHDNGDLPQHNFS